MDMTSLTCHCNHLTTFTATDIVVPVNTIDFSEVFSADITDNALVFSTIIVLFVLYVIAVILLRRKDKQDIINVSTF